jgi:hypothetical protein
MPLPPTPNWAALTAAIYPHLSEAEREALTKIWATNYANFHPLKAQLSSELDPEPVVDLTSTGSLGEQQ